MKASRRALGLKNSTKAPCLAVFGTGSEVGKSIVVTALARCFVQDGIRVAPYKAQNMSNNSGVTPEGLEMGRAQLVQAEAARIPPHVDMNPVLLKPTGETGSQLVLSGKAVATLSARRYYRRKEALFRRVTAALNRLRRRYDGILIEGAGSCAEVNLMEHDIVNFTIAQAADAPVILVADIHKGGVFGQIVGTLACLPLSHRDRIAGILINRFRGDPRLFTEGAAWIEKKTRKRVLGVLPWHHGIRIDPEDSVVLEHLNPAPKSTPGAARVAVVRIPHISNFTDFEPLFAVSGLEVVYIERAGNLSSFHAVILPGSKNTRSDLDWLAAAGFKEALTSYVKNGGHVLGICGGYQMLGIRVHDEKGLEGPPGHTAGLAFLPVETRLKAPKRTTRTRFSWNGAEGVGYEIHMGQTRRKKETALFQILRRNDRPCKGEDGCATTDGRVLGTYIHGLFDTPAVTRQWLDTLGLGHLSVPEDAGLMARDRQYDLLADHFRKHVDMDYLTSLFTKAKRSTQTPK
ncbi:MAG: cobyric acid synthase [Deltaproteobacteria bacterium]|nr:cobyric acid synthase [Deltaproteobacteria bacterium]